MTLQGEEGRGVKPQQANLCERLANSLLYVVDICCEDYRHPCKADGEIMPDYKDGEYLEKELLPIA